MTKTVNYSKTSIEIRTLIASTYSSLLILKKEGNQSGFNSLMETLIPSVKHYLSRQLSIAEKHHELPKKKYKVDDFVDELYIQAYEYIHEVNGSEELRTWLFKKAYEILQDAIVDEDFDSTYFKNIDNYTKVEWDAMEEKFSVDGGGDFVMIEDLDDRSYPKQDYVLQDVFIEDKEFDFIKRLSEKLSEEEIHKQIDLVLHLLPLSIRSIYELTINEQFDSEEIAKIKDISVEEVERILGSARHTILSSFVKKYLPH